MTVIGALFEEAASSIGKLAVKLKIESPYSMGVVTNFWNVVLFLSLTLVKWPEQKISIWTTLIIRIVLETILGYITVNAITRSSRSTFSFIRSGTIPLLLIVDFILGYRIDLPQLVGIALISICLFILFANHGLDKKGLSYVLASTFLAVATISLFKYDINHGNSLELEQSLIGFSTLIFFLIMAKRTKAKLYKLIKEPLVLAQAATQALAAAFGTYGLSLIPPSVHIAASRSTTMIAAVSSGKLVFHEKRLGIKILALIFCVIGILLLSL